MSEPAARFATPVALLFGLFALLGTGCFDSRDAGPNAPREAAPEFSLTRLDGQPATLADYKGRAVILDFWATWCAPCEIQMPVLDTLWKTKGGDELMILGISVDTDPAEKVVSWIEKRGFAYPIAIASQDLAIDYGVIGFPTLVVLDPAGRIHTRHVGVLSRPELEDILEEIAREPSSTPSRSPGIPPELGP